MVIPTKAEAEPAKAEIKTAKTVAKVARTKAQLKAEAAAEAKAEAKAAKAKAEVKSEAAAESRAEVKAAKAEAEAKAAKATEAKAEAEAAKAEAKAARAKVKAAKEAVKAAEPGAKAEAKAVAKTAKAEATSKAAQAAEAKAAAKAARAEAKAAKAAVKEARAEAKAVKAEARAAKAEAKVAREEAKAARAEAKAAKEEAQLARDKVKRLKLLQQAIQTEDSAPSFSEREVLAQNLSSEALRRLQALGFSVQDESAQDDINGEGITKIIVPSDMTAIDTILMLDQEFPDEQFHLNRIYRIYHPAAKIEPELQNKKTEQGGERCSQDHCYGRDIIHWKENFAQCTSKRKIGIVDTKVDLQHTAFDGRNIRHRTILPQGRQLAESGHGTGIASLLAGRPDSSTPGLISESSFHVASIFFKGDDGSVQTDTDSLLKALVWLKRSGVQFVNMSFSGPEDGLVESCLRKLRKQGMVFAAAAGNEGLSAGPSYPAAYPQVVAVTAVDKKMKIYASANRGDYIDVAAPGVHIWTAAPNSQEGYQSGTSFAVPFMTAMLAIQPPEILRLPKDEILARVKTVRLEGGSRTYGRGLLQAPNECPNAIQFVDGWAPVLEASFRSGSQSSQSQSASYGGGNTSYSGEDTDLGSRNTSPSGGGTSHGGRK